MPPLLPSAPMGFNGLTPTVIQSTQISTTSATPDDPNLLAAASTSSASDSNTSQVQRSNASSVDQGINASYRDQQSIASSLDQGCNASSSAQGGNASSGNQGGNAISHNQSNATANQNIAGGGGQAAIPNTLGTTKAQISTAGNVQITVCYSGRQLTFQRPYRGMYARNRSDRVNENQTERPLRLPLPVNNSVSGNLPLPPNWNENMESVCRSSVDRYKLFPVPSWTLQFRKLAELLDPLAISDVQQIVNPAVWKRFVNERNEMLKAKSSDPMVLKELGLSDQEIARKQQSLNFLRHIEVDGAPYDDNFSLLFHCTRDPANIELILRDGFDERMSKGGMLGKGIYFSDHPRKSSSYDRCDGVIFVCAVLLGDCFTCKDAASRDISGLVKGPEKLPGERRFIDDYHFDSVNGNFKFNEYAVYNRYQCYPLYKVTYSRVATKYTENFSSDCAVPPPFGWLPENEIPKLTYNLSWSLHAKAVFSEILGMEELEAIESVDVNPSKISIARKLDCLKYKGHADKELNLRILEENNYDIGKTVDALLQRNIGEFVKLMELHKKGIGANKNKSEESLDHSSAVDDVPKKRQMLHKSSTEQDTKPLVSLEPTEEFCFICCNPYSTTSNNCMKLLLCEHKLCAECYKRIEITRETMTGVSHTSIKCPFCQRTAGTAIGICPNGVMSESIIPSHCAGYEDCDTIVLTYTVKALMEPSAGLRYLTHAHFQSPVRRRQAFLPNNPEGKSILNLLRIAWDRRLIFTIGSSHTTGRDNALIWNIHHKTLQTGGSHCHGYPDATYLKRVRDELKSFGIE